MMTTPNGKALAGTDLDADIRTHPSDDTGDVPGGNEDTVRLDAGSVLDCNQPALDAIQADASTPPYATRALAMESLAVHDVLRAIAGKPGCMGWPWTLPPRSPLAPRSLRRPTTS
jgi:hypothetical protein